ncbi:MAG: hypothetical protein EWV92_09035 [Microcystis aeruginosa Ma_MB_S_20031200_S102]|uniref:Uncharacterized protein n=1 Tax=Microcystis aeruginosa Ma_MB_S_20031200_S102 TaxID=2486254 RepID=A0A552EUB2_MICAE|nr:MAG: hypothetical protein EWV79_10635 [Microcystis aeruginosa Ma_MB_S_20031200_S102D]TRU38056.1 MAG: hypothetical protein EWV92_09035 [Microcystis aeruginosa Ma_MB_S_20031200_S102]
MVIPSMFCKQPRKKEPRTVLNAIPHNKPTYIGLAEKVWAKHSDRKSPVSPIGYCPNASPLQDAGR